MQRQNRDNPLRDPGRLALLHSLDLLDGPDVPALERLTRLASTTLQSTGAVVSLVDADRLVLKAGRGLPQEIARRRELSLDWAISTHVIVSRTPLVIDDTRSHPLAPPELDRLGVLAYAGVPLLLEGHVLGTLNVVHDAPRRWSESEVAILTDLADSIMTEVQLQREVRQRLEAETSLQLEIREHQATIEALIRREALGKALVEQLPTMIWTTDRALTITFVEGGLLSGFGITAEHYLGRSVPDLRLPDGWARRAGDAHLRALNGDTQTFEVEFESRVFQCTVQPLASPVGVVGGCIGIAHDISERKRADVLRQEAYSWMRALNDQLLRSRDLLRTLLDGLDAGVALLDEGGRVLAANAALAALLQREIGALVDRDWEQICRAYGLSAGFVLQTLQDHRPRSRREEYTASRGERRFLDLRSLPLLNGAQGSNGLIVHVVDVTERMAMEAMAVQNERLATGGKLAATMAHEINTPLQSILSCLDLARSAVEERRQSYLTLAREEITRIARILHRMLDLYRPHLEVPLEFQLNELVERVLQLTTSTLHERAIAIQTSLAPGLPSLYGRADQLIQVLINMILNAVDAMPQGGTLYVTTARTGAEPPELSIMLQDNGSGMTPEVQQRIFDPFFTTKVEGTGIGLAISQTIISRHGGRIEVESEPGRGATFTILLPGRPQPRS